MSKTQSVISIGLLITAAGLFSAASGSSPQEAQVLTGQSAVATPANDAPPTNALIEQLKVELDRVTQSELMYGCLTSKENGRYEFCGDSKDRVEMLQNQLGEEVHKQELADRTPDGLAQVKNNIQGLAEREVSVTFIGTSLNPYTNKAKRIEHWQDDRGFLYLVDRTNNHVVQFGPGPDRIIVFERDGSKSLTIEQLQQLAEKYLSKHVADFDLVKANFIFRQMSKAGNVSYAFRWEANTIPNGEDRRPFVQVVLSPIGEVMSFNDTRSLYSK